MPAHGETPCGGGPTLPPEDLDRLARAGRPLDVSVGQVLFRRGEPGDAMFVVEAGEIELRFDGDKPPKRLGPGCFFGEVSLLAPGSRRSGTAVVTTAGTLRAVAQGEFEALTESHPKVLISLLRQTCSYLADSERGLMADLKRQSTARHPFPIAAPHRLMLSESTAGGGVQRLFDVIEMTLRWLGACVASELSVAGKAARIEPWFEKPMSTGAVHGWVREVVAAREGGRFTEALGPLYRSSGRGASIDAELDELIAARNRTRGHGITLTDQQCRKLRTELEPQLELVLERLEVLHEFRPLVVKGMMNYDGQTYEHDVLLAMGDNPYFPADTLRTSQPLPFGRVYLHQPDRSLVPMAPFLRYEDCTTCTEKHLFLLQAAHGGKLQHVDPLKGCTKISRLDAAV